MEDKRFGCAAEVLGDSGTEGKGSISVAENERFRDGERKELGDRDERLCVGDGYDVIGGRRLSSFSDSRCSCKG